MTEYKFNVTGDERKRLVAAIVEILGVRQRYLGMPTASYEIGDFTVTKDGTLIGEDSLSLMVGLAERGFEPELSGRPGPENGSEQTETDPENGSEQMPEPGPENGSEPNHLTISVPLAGFDPPAIDRLVKMVNAKEALLKQALGADDLPIRMEAQELAFPWFSGELDGETVEAYTLFITALTETAKRKKRVTAKPVETTNAKFSLRVWLTSLGMTGEKYRLARKRLISGLSGNSAWRYGRPEKTVAVSAEAGGEPDVD